MECIANKQRQKYGKSKVSISQVHALFKNPSWDPKEWDGNIWTGSSDSNIKFEPDFSDKEVVVEARPLIQMEEQQDQMDRRVQVTRTYTPKELQEFLETYHQKSRERTLAWISQAWDSGAVSIHLLVSQKDLLTPIATDNKIQQGYAQLRNIRGPDGWDIVAAILYQWLCVAVLTAHADTAQLVSSLRLVYNGKRYWITAAGGDSSGPDHRI